MGHAVDLQPAGGIDLVAADLAADPLGEDFRPAAGERAEAALDQPLEHFAVGKPELLGEVVNLHGREGLQVQGGKMAADLPAAARYSS